MRHSTIPAVLALLGFASVTGITAAQADTIPTVHFRDLVAGQSSLTYGQAFGVWSCWKDPKLNISLYAMDAAGKWQTVSTDNRLTRDAVNCNVPGLPYLAMNAWTVAIHGSQGTGVQRNVIVLGLGWKSAAPTSAFSLAPTGQPAANAPKVVTWDGLSAGTAALPLGRSVTVAYPNCGSNRLYALDSTGSLGSWRQVATGCTDAWTVKNPGSQGAGSQAGVTLLAAAPAQPQYTYGLAKVQ